MPRGRSASSFRSESSDIDIDGIGMIKLRLCNNIVTQVMKNTLFLSFRFCPSLLCLVQLIEEALHVLCVLWCTSADTEMVKLQRQFRIMEGDRKAYSIQSQELIRKQRCV